MNLLRAISAFVMLSIGHAPDVEMLVPCDYCEEMGMVYRHRFFPNKQPVGEWRPCPYCRGRCCIPLREVI